MDLANLLPVQQYGRPDFGKTKACRKPTFLFWQKDVAATVFPKHEVAPDETTWPTQLF